MGVLGETGFGEAVDGFNELFTCFVSLVLGLFTDVFVLFDLLFIYKSLLMFILT